MVSYSSNNAAIKHTPKVYLLLNRLHKAIMLIILIISKQISQNTHFLATKMSRLLIIFIRDLQIQIRRTLIKEEVKNSLFKMTY